MRTALLAWDYPPSPSGLSTAAREIAESLAEAGADATVFTMDRTGREIVNGVTIIGCAIPEKTMLAKLRLFGGIGHMAAPSAFRQAVLTEHRRRPFDVLEATNWYAPASLLVSCLPVVTRNSTPAAFSRDNPGSMRDRVDAWAADRLERKQAQGSAALISNTDDHGQRMQEHYRLQVDAQPHAVIGLSLSPDSLQRAAHATYPSGVASPIRLLFVGRAEHRKGFDTILEAVSILRVEALKGAIPAFVVDLVGIAPDDLPPGLDQEDRKCLNPVGRVHETALAGFYEAAHAVLAPSRYESFGLVYQEGLAYGRPMIASSEDASARVFVGMTGAGIMAERNTGNALAAAIRPVLNDPDLRSTLRTKALKAAGRFNRETLGRETLALYEKAITAYQAR
ncbi:glycosyltransferase family 4 protein [Tianweitania populi]|uniref:Glycosyl transferase family 1 n=1 Tax=Tianweitania populi TaxID=1607949 RepID=A0A8J3GLK5_9HYPH|nr:glycosyltransferase family 4 protein [Tianweitania populi]GHD18093.1 glycosyl transferase family 1 [Tianweitania populi]